jgi:hypothetical protein
MSTSQSNAVPSHDAAISPTAGAVVRDEFGARELAVRGDVNAQRAAAEAQALVQARYVMAMQRPRDWDDVRVKLMREVERPGFADVAWYRKPIGKGVEGLSVRFAEAAARCMGNLLIKPQTTYEDATKRLVEVLVTDLENNLTISLDVTVEKTVERKSLSDGRVALSVRKNSQNEITYTVPATEDEMLGKTNSNVSKARRVLILQVLPGDIADTAKTRILEIRRGAVAKDPEGARKKVVDAFATLNVMPSDLKRYLGHDVAQSSPSEIQDLRDLYSSIVGGEATWQEAIAEKLGTDGEPTGVAEKKTGIEAVTEKLEGKVTAPAVAATTTAPALACDHPKVKPSDVAGGKSAVCPDCNATITDPDAPAVGTAEPSPRDAVQALSEKAGDTTKARGRQGRLQD